MTLLGSKRISITVYHPNTYEMVEHLHLQKKEALMASSSTHGWVDLLFLVLLNIHASFKHLECTAAEIAYGSTIALSDFLLSIGGQDPGAFVQRLCDHMAHIHS